jgi:hypothetical protein
VCFVQPRSEEFWNLSTKATENELYFVPPRTETFWNLPTKETRILFCRVAEDFGICQQKPPKLTDYGQPSSENLFELRTMHCILFSRATKIFGICQQKPLKDFIRFGRAAKDFELRSKALHFVLPRSEKEIWRAKFFGISQQKPLKLTVIAIKSSVFCSSEKFGAANKSSVSCSTVRENFWNLPTKATQIHRNRISFSRTAKAFGICQQKRLKLIAFSCSKKIWN